MAKRRVFVELKRVVCPKCGKRFLSKSWTYDCLDAHLDPYGEPSTCNGGGAGVIKILRPGERSPS